MFMVRWTVLVVLMLVCGCGSNEPRKDKLADKGKPNGQASPADGANGKTLVDNNQTTAPRVAGAADPITGAQDPSAPLPVTNGSDKEARYSDSYLVASVSSGFYESTDGENGWYMTPEIYLRPGALWRNTGLPGDLRINGKVAYSKVEGEFQAGNNEVKFQQKRVTPGIGLNWQWTNDAHSWGTELNALYQHQYADRMRRDDGVRTSKEDVGIPEGRVTLWSGGLLPVLFQSDKDGYTSLEGIINTNLESDVVWVRGTLKTELATFGSIAAGNVGDAIMGRTKAGTWPVVSLRAGPRYQAFGEGNTDGWAHALGGYAEIYIPAVALSIDGHVVTDVAGKDYAGTEYMAGVYVALTF